MSKSQEIEDSDRGLVILAGYLKFALEFYLILILSQNEVVTSLFLAVGSMIVTCYIVMQIVTNQKLLFYFLPIAGLIPVINLLFMPGYDGWIISLIISFMCGFIVCLDLKHKVEKSVLQKA